MPLAVFIFRSFMTTLPKAVQVVTVTLGGLIGGNQILGWQVVTGGALITMAVLVLVFVTLQRYFVRGLTAGSVNG